MGCDVPETKKPLATIGCSGNLKILSQVRVLENFNLYTVLQPTQCCTDRAGLQVTTLRRALPDGHHIARIT